MRLFDYYRLNQRLVRKKSAYLEKEFLENVFYPEFGDEGLNHIIYQKRIYDNNNNRYYYIDFVIYSEGKKYAIELDGYNYHGKLSYKDFEKQEERTNEIISQCYELIRFSYNKVKNKPNEVRRELRQRVNLPKTKVEETTIPVDNNASDAKKNNSSIAILFVAIFLSIAFVYNGFNTYKQSSVSNNQTNKTSTQSTVSNTNTSKANVQSFINYHNNVSNYKISDLQRIDLKDNSSQFYRATNTYIGTYNYSKYYAVHGYIDSSDIWIISCNSNTDPKSMRIYAESSDYNLLVNIVHTSIPYFYPNDTDNDKLLEKFDNLIQNNRWGIYGQHIKQVYTILKQNNEGSSTMLYDKEYVKNWRLNLNTNCNDFSF